MDKAQARTQWDSAAPGWARWEQAVGEWLAASTPAMLDAAGVVPGARVLDVACGAGDQSFAAARRVGAAGHVVATDISSEMIAFVERQAADNGLANVSARCSAAEDLAGDGEVFDAAICRLGLMLIPDPVAIVRSVRALLRPGGRFAAVTIAEPEANPYLAGPLGILRRHAGKPVPPPGTPGIFALSDAQRLVRVFEEGGLVDVQVRTIDDPLVQPSARHALEMMQEAFGVYRATIGDQPEATRQAAWREVEDYLRGFEGRDGLRMPSRFHVAAGARPA